MYLLQQVISIATNAINGPFWVYRSCFYDTIFVVREGQNYFWAVNGRAQLELDLDYNFVNDITVGFFRLVHKQEYNDDFVLSGAL